VDPSWKAHSRPKRPVEDDEYSAQVRQRFERDFLPRFGSLWRSMLQKAQDKENEANSIDHQSIKAPEKSPGVTMDFMDAIARIKPVTILAGPPIVHNEDCGCGCEPPTMEKMEADKDSNDDDSTSVPEDVQMTMKRNRHDNNRVLEEMNDVETIESTATDGKNVCDNMAENERVFDLDQLRKNLPNTSSPCDDRIGPPVGRTNDVLKSRHRIRIEDTDDESSNRFEISSDEEENEFDTESNGDFESDCGSEVIIRNAERTRTEFEIKEDWTKNEAQQKPASVGKYFLKNRDELTRATFDEFNRYAFGGALGSVEVIWNKKLQTTAGLTRLRRCKANMRTEIPFERLACIELSTKVVNSQDRLRSTLLHELVHAVVWIVDGVDKPPHGPNFKKWARIAMSRIPGVRVTTTHSYEIEYRHTWKCSNPSCSGAVQRHSRSFDPTRYRCGKCNGNFVEERGFRSSKNQSQPSAYNAFVKEHSKTVREELLQAQRSSGALNPTVAQSDVMKECARLWRERKSD
jgi:predicted SprT family Zn-dependent metalloprotease